MCMVMFGVMVAISAGFSAFSVGASDTAGMIPSTTFFDYNYCESTKALTNSAAAFEEASATSDVLGIITIGLGAIITLSSIILNVFVSSILGYVTLFTILAGMIEPDGGGITILLLMLGAILSLMAIYGFFTIVRSVLVR